MVYSLISGNRDDPYLSRHIRPQRGAPEKRQQSEVLKDQSRIGHRHPQPPAQAYLLRPIRRSIRWSRLGGVAIDGAGRGGAGRDGALGID